ncbi:MAG: hypothetical protein JRG79_21030, partial [Deltaproteobacteria bacterium]|nr:hypothetical protein [Deltaproteobacteria bacterium]
MSATAIPLFRTYQQRAYGSQASLVMKQLLDAQILYYLDKNKFYPEVGNMVQVYQDYSQNNEEILSIAGALNVTIPVGNHLDYNIRSEKFEGGERCFIMITAQFPLFKNRARELWGEARSDGYVGIYTVN